jgi:outer membrane protein TolC
MRMVALLTVGLLLAQAGCRGTTGPAPPPVPLAAAPDVSQVPAPGTPTTAWPELSRPVPQPETQQVLDAPLPAGATSADVRPAAFEAPLQGSLRGSFQNSLPLPATMLAATVQEVPAVPTEPPLDLPPPAAVAESGQPEALPSVRPQANLPPVARELAGPVPAEIQPLALPAVAQSVYYAFPGLEIALRELDIAAGKEQAAQGEFDLKLKAGSESDPLGFYKTYVNAIKLEQALWQGGGVYSQYRIGEGNFPTWDDRETNGGGEFKVGFLHPILQNWAIDQRRADVLQATLRRQQVEPAVQGLLLELVRDAAQSYWAWIAAGRSYDVQRELLRVTVERNKVYEGRVAEGDLPRIELVQNQRLIASREAKLVEARRKLQATAIKLSLYLRDDRGMPLVAPPAWLPTTFPLPPPPDPAAGDSLLAGALANRPELRELDIVRQQVEVDIAQAQNLFLPELTATLDAAKDVGEPTPSGNKTPFQLEAGLYFNVPLQRNKAQGKLREAQGKIAQIAAKRRLVENKIVIEVQDALSDLTTSYERFLRARENAQLAWELAAAERERFELEDSDLLRVALQESAAIEAALAEIDALVGYYQAEAAYRAALGTPPLEIGAEGVEPESP